MNKLSMDQIAELFGKVLSKHAVAAIINGFLSCDDDERLSDDEVNFGCGLFDSLCEKCPEAMELAQN